MAQSPWHAQAFGRALDAFHEAEDDYVKAARARNCIAQNNAWAAMRYYLGSMQSEADALLDDEVNDNAQRELAMAERVMDRIGEKFKRSCVKAI